MLPPISFLAIVITSPFEKLPVPELSTLLISAIKDKLIVIVILAPFPTSISS